jgi:hypothetical protein
MRAQDALAEIVEASVPLFLRFTVGFDDKSATARTDHTPNHLIWTLGHLALTMYRGAERLGPPVLPSDRFVTADGRGGDRGRFDTESVCFGSVPVDDRVIYPTLARGVETLEHAATTLADAIRSLSDEQLGMTIEWGRATSNLTAFIARLVSHNGTHTGQIIELRRGLGMPGVIG